MVGWDGQGLPPSAAARLERSRRSRLRTSLLGVPAAAAAESVDLTPVGEVMGSIVEHLGFQGWGGCGWYGGRGWAGPAGWRQTGGPGGWAPGGSAGPGGFAGPGGWSGATVSSGGRDAYAGYGPYVQAVYRGYHTALDRMLMEARGLGADGVVGVRLTVEHLGQSNREFVALGTAVRAKSPLRPAAPFVTDLSGPDVAKALRGGWVPVSLAIGISVAIRHDDWATLRQASAWINSEVSGYTELVSQVRAEARDQFAASAQRAAAETALVSRMDMRVWTIEPSEGHRDHVAEATVIGTALVRFHPTVQAPTRALTVLPLGSV